MFTVTSKLPRCWCSSKQPNTVILFQSVHLSDLERIYYSRFLLSVELVHCAVVSTLRWKFFVFLIHLMFPQGARGNDGAAGAAGPPVSSQPLLIFNGIMYCAVR